jgi:hypothetical protein
MATNRVASAIERVRKPEYTGENRCIPCTVTNLVIGVVASVGVATLAVVVGGVAPAWGTAAGGLLFLLSVASIYLRGYLVPGTPELTKRYFPPWLLDLFGNKESERRAYDLDEEIDVEAALVGTGILEEKPHGDLGLTAAFHRAWYDQIAVEREGETDREALADIVGLDEDGLEFDEFGDRAFVARYDGHRVGHWESRAAFLADAAAGRVLPDYYDDWEQASPTVRGQLLAGLRLFAEQCPSCEGPVHFGQEVVESCCRTHDVVAVTCEDCDSRLFEVDVTDEMLGGADGGAA